MKKYLSLLENSPLFKDMTSEEILSILDCMDAKIVTKCSDEYLKTAGETTETIGMLLSGHALIIQEDVWGHRNVMAGIEPGEIFGEAFAASPGARMNVSVVAQEECKVLSMNLQKLLTTCPNACVHHNKMIHNLVAAFAQKILMINDKLTHMSKRSTREKLLSYLSEQAKKQNSRCFTIPYDRQQLADFLCVERAAMSAELSKLQKEGLIQYHKNAFELL